jgi:hypothetical protein
MNFAAEKVDAGQQAHRAVAFIFKLACEGGMPGLSFAFRHANDTSQALASSVIVGSRSGRSSSAAIGPSTTVRSTQRWTV